MLPSLPAANVRNVNHQKPKTKILTSCLCLSLFYWVCGARWWELGGLLVSAPPRSDPQTPPPSEVS